MIKVLFPIYVLFFLLNAVNLLGQQNQYSHNVYLMAFERYIEDYQKFEINTDKLYFKEEVGVTDNLPKNYKGYSIVLLNERDFKKTLRKEKSLTLTYISPVLVYNNNLMISIYDIGYTKKMFNTLSIRAYEGDWACVIRYSCENETFFIDISPPAERRIAD